MGEKDNKKTERRWKLIAKKTKLLTLIIGNHSFFLTIARVGKVSQFNLKLNSSVCHCFLCRSWVIHTAELVWNALHAWQTQVRRGPAAAPSLTPRYCLVPFTSLEARTDIYSAKTCWRIKQQTCLECKARVQVTEDHNPYKKAHGLD